MTNTKVVYDLTEVKEFLDKSYRHTKSIWLRIGTYDIYVRTAYHMIEDQHSSTFDIANISNEGERGKGGFWQLMFELKEFLKDYPIKYMYIENVHNIPLTRGLSLRGWSTIPSIDKYSPCFYKKVQDDV